MRLVSVPEHLEYVQKTNFANYEKGALQAGIMRDGEFLFTLSNARSLTGLLQSSARESLLPMEPKYVVSRPSYSNCILTRPLSSGTSSARVSYKVRAPVCISDTLASIATSKIFSANNFRGVITRAIDDDIAKLRTIIGNHADAGREFDLAVRLDIISSSANH